LGYDQSCTRVHRRFVFRVYILLDAESHNGIKSWVPRHVSPGESLFQEETRPGSTHTYFFLAELVGVR
jgi:hypothetical protein